MTIQTTIEMDTRKLGTKESRTQPRDQVVARLILPLQRYEKDVTHFEGPRANKQTKAAEDRVGAQKTSPHEHQMQG